MGKPAHVTVHHLSDSRSQRILWLLEELDIPYTINRIERVNGRAPPESYKISPLGRFPVISFEDKSLKTDGDVVLAESGAIVEYLLRTCAPAPRLNELQKIDDLYFAHYAEGSLMPLLVNKLIFTIAPSKSPWFIRPLVRLILNGLCDVLVTPQLAIHGKFIESHLAKQSTDDILGQEGTGSNEQTEVWFAGGPDLTAADYQMIFPLEAFFSRAEGADKAEHARKYVQRVHARPAYQRALERGGEYKYAAL